MLFRSIEPLLQEAFDGQMLPILESAYGTIRSALTTSQARVVTEIVTRTMEDSSSLSLRVKTRNELIVQLDSMLGDSIDESLEKVIQKMDVYDILDAYDYAYDVIYNRELKKNTNPELTAELRRRLENLDHEEAFYQGQLVRKVRESIIYAIATDCLDGLELDWSEGTTVRTAIGQGSNAFTPVQMARYMAALANGHTVYNLRLVNGIFDSKVDGVYEPKESTIFGELDLKQSTIDIVHQGMYKVTHGSAGSARAEFRTYEIEVAGKTGTAQKGKHEHSWFVGFAPYDNPQVAFVTAMYYADSLGSYTRLMARDMLTDYFGLDEEPATNTLDNMFIE